jgi:IS1 family transposase
MASVSNRSSKQNKESITLIWFDSDTDENVNTEDTINSLRSINDYVLVYTNVQECISYIKSVRKEKIFLIASGTSTPFLLSLIIDLKQLELVFIFCDRRQEYLYLMEKYSKVSGVFINREDLNLNIRKHIHSLNKQIEAFSFYDQKQTLSMDLSERTGDFLR